MKFFTKPWNINLVHDYKAEVLNTKTKNPSLCVVFVPECHD